MGNPVVHFRIPARDAAAMSAFYGGVFGWRIEPRPLTSVKAGVTDSYPFVDADAGGITVAVEDGHGSVIVVEVDDIEATLRRVEELGGRRRFPEAPAELMSMGADGGADFELAEFVDPEGNLVDIIHR
jgi:uncharacterized protein